MCVDHDARLPALPAGDQSAITERVVLTAPDGNHFSAFAAEPAERVRRSAVIVLPDVRGLFGFYEDLAVRFAEHGHPAIAIDYFGRTAGTEERPADFPFMDHVAETHSDGINADIAAAGAYLRERHLEAELYAVGFCFGGTVAWAAATHGHGLAGVIGYYGRTEVDRPAGDGPIWDRCHLMEGRLLALFGGADPAIPPENVARFEAALEEAGVDHEVVVYPGAPHSFFDRSQEDFLEESLDTWKRTLELIR